MQKCVRTAEISTNVVGGWFTLYVWPTLLVNSGRVLLIKCLSNQCTFVVISLFVFFADCESLSWCTTSLSASGDNMLLNHHRFIYFRSRNENLPLLQIRSLQPGKKFKPFRVGQNLLLFYLIILHFVGSITCNTLALSNN